MGDSEVGQTAQELIAVLATLVLSVLQPWDKVGVESLAVFQLIRYFCHTVNHYRNLLAC